jgi:hypothetical protein
MTEMDESSTKEIIEARWQARQAPHTDGVVFPSGRMVTFDYCVQSDERVFDFGIHDKGEDTLSAFIARQGDDDAWTPLLTIGVHECPEYGVRVEFGEGSFGCYGFVACTDIVTNRLQWLAFFQASNPFVQARCRGDAIEATTNLGHMWTFPMRWPECLAVKDASVLLSGVRIIQATNDLALFSGALREGLRASPSRPTGCPGARGLAAGRPGWRGQAVLRADVGPSP